MFNQSVSIVEFTKLYNILKEIENLFKFKIINYKTSDDFINEIKANNLDILKSTIIITTENNRLFSLLKT